MSKVRKWMMEERCVPDPAIKLFGKTIPVPIAKADNSSNQEGVDESRTQSEEELDELGRSSSAGSNEEQHKRPEESSSENVAKQQQSPSKKPGGGNIDKKQKSEQQQKQEEEEENNVKEEMESTDKVPKKPDKPVPCPRCDSMDTKFCYYNNYNINQPRHFCKNCQRYWTSGGTLRNVPVGAGRRKNKHAAAAVNSSHHLHQQQHHQPQWADAAGLNYHALKLVAPRILQAAPPPPPGDDGSIITSLGGQHSSADGSFRLIHPMSSSNSEVTSMWQQQQHNRECDSVCGSPAKMNSSRRDQLSSTSTSTSTSSKSNAAAAEKACIHRKCPDEASAAARVFPMGLLGKNSIPNNGPYSSFQQTYKLEPAAAAAAEDHESNMAAAAAAWAGGGMPCWPPPPLPPLPPALAAAAGQWSMQWAAVAAVAAVANANNAAAASAAAATSTSQPLLGKRNPVGEGGLWVPKTLRIDDPGDAARSSIWAALGVERKQHTTDAAAADIGMFQNQSSSSSNEQQQHQAKLMQCIQLQEGLRANPAAMARSATFQESN